MSARLQNSPVPFEFGGRVYQVTPEPTFEVEAAFQTWLEREAYLALWRHKDAMEPADYRERLRGWNNDCAAGVYAYDGDVAYRSIHESEKGWRELAWLLMQHARAKTRQGPAPTRELIEEVAGDAAKKRELLWIVWGAKESPAGEEPSPNAAGPEATPPPAGA